MCSLPISPRATGYGVAERKPLTLKPLNPKPKP